MLNTETTRIDALLPANHVEAINGLLFPWNETNQPHTFVLEVQNDDATVTVARAEGEINVGRPPQLPPGAMQHAVLAVNIDTIFPAPGGYRIVASVDEGKDTATWAFRVHDVHARSETVI